MAKTVIIDAELQTLNGHNFQASLRSARSARAEGGEVALYVNRFFDPTAAPELAEFEVVPHFPAQAFDFPGLTGGRVPQLADATTPSSDFALEDLLARLIAMIDHAGLGPGDRLYIHTLSREMLSALYLLYRSLPAARLPRLYGLIYTEMSLFQGWGYGDIGLAELLGAFKMSGLLGSRVFLHVETRNLQRHFAARGFDMPVMMGPVEMPEGGPGAGTRAPGILFIGDAREEKGFYLVPDIVEALIRDNVRPDRRIYVQTSSSAATRPGNLQAVERLKALAEDHDRLILLPEMSGADYEAVLARGTVFVLPYARDRYLNRGSGIAYEALTQGAMIVCTRGIDIAASFADTGRVIEADPNPDDMARAIVAAEDHPLWTREEIEAAMRPYTVGHFFQSLAAAHGSADAVTPAPARRTVLYATQAPLHGPRGATARAHLRALACLDADVRVQLLPPDGALALSESDKSASWAVFARNPDLLPRATLEWAGTDRAAVSNLARQTAADPRLVVDARTAVTLARPSGISRRIDADAPPSALFAANATAAAYLAEQVRSDSPMLCEIGPSPAAAARTALERRFASDWDVPRPTDTQRAWLDRYATARQAEEARILAQTSARIATTQAFADVYGQTLGPADILPPFDAGALAPRASETGPADLESFATLASSAQAAILQRALFGAPRRARIALDLGGAPGQTARLLSLARDIVAHLRKRLPDAVMFVAGAAAEGETEGIQDCGETLPEDVLAQTKVRLVLAPDLRGTEALAALAQPVPAVFHPEALGALLPAARDAGLPMHDDPKALAADLAALLNAPDAVAARRAAQARVNARLTDPERRIRRIAHHLGVAVDESALAAACAAPGAPTRIDLAKALDAVERSADPGPLPFDSDAGFPVESQGWSLRETQHRWVEGCAGLVVFRPTAPVRALTLGLRLLPEVAHAAPEAEIAVLGYGTVPRRLGTGEDRFTLAFSPPLPAGDRAVVCLSARRAIHPENDDRVLSLSCSHFELLETVEPDSRIAKTLTRQSPQARAEAVLSGTLAPSAIPFDPVLASSIIEAAPGAMAFTPGPGAVPAESLGWSIPEAAHRWVEGDRAYLVLRPEAPVNRITLRLKLLAEVAAVAPTVHVALTGFPDRRLSVTAEESSHEITLAPPLPAGQPFVLRLAAERSTRPSYDGRSLSIDCAGITLG